MKKQYAYKIRDQVYWPYIEQTVKIVDRRMDALINIPIYAVRAKGNRVIRWIAEDQLTVVVK